ncbi:g10513 [Coccomyxa elongata]
MATKQSQVKRKHAPVLGQRPISAFFSPKTEPLKVIESNKGDDNQCNKKQRVTEKSPSASAPIPHLLSAEKAPEVVNRTEQAAEPCQKLPGNRHGEEVVGLCCKVFWVDDKKWYKGVISQHDASKGKHLVEYEDGDTEWLDLAQEKIELLQKPGEATHAKKPLKRLIKRKAILESDDEEEAAVPMDDSGDESGSEFIGADAASSESDSDESAAASDEDQAPPKRKTPAKQRAPQSAKNIEMAPQQASKTPAPVLRSAGAAVRSTPQQKAAGAVMQAALNKDAPATDTKGSKGGVEPAGDIARYAKRAEERFPFLAPEQIRDANKKRPDQPGYNPRTLYIPPDWFKKAKVSEGQRQWWEFKAQHFDSVMLFKMGKFYEMFEMDAHVGAEVLGLTYMKGEQPHCGFPEVNYLMHAERLVRAGLRVVVVEQTETPDMLRIRNEQRPAGQAKCNVVRREVVAILTSGTLSDPDMLRAQPEAAYVLSLWERPAPPVALGGPPRTLLGACYTDCASNTLTLGQWHDDVTRSQLRAQLAEMRPVELVLPAGGLGEATQRVLKAALRGPRTNRPAALASAADVVTELDDRDYFSRAAGKEPGSRDAWPTLLKAMAEQPGDNEATLMALGLARRHLEEVLLDGRVLPLGAFRPLPGCQHVAGTDSHPNMPQYMALDGSAFDNLEVLENTDGGATGSLIACLDMCATVMGKRQLRAWLCRPMARIVDITARQDAVAELMGPAAEAAQAARSALTGLGDLERALARLQASTLAEGDGTNAAIYYEDTAKRKVLALITVLRGLQSVQEAWEGFRQMGNVLKSAELRRLTTGPAAAGMAAPLKELQQFTDWEQAAELGRIVPHSGADAAFDDADARVAAVEADLAQHLKDVRKKLGCSGITYVSLNKDSHLLDIPDSAADGVPSSYELVGQKKGWKRYRSPRLAELVQDLARAQEDREAALSGILQGVVRRFAREHAAWEAAVQAVAELDALMSLAAVADVGSSQGPMCRPKLVTPQGDQKVFKAKGLRHPSAGLHLSAGATFIPNDIQLGGAEAPFIILTGPNMGGKSTLLRQVCLAALMAQVGAWVPADSLEMTPVDAIFVRMGARDAIMTGQSTFLVELTETAAALNRATCASLVALDELGRGTATTDGAAIAAAVIHSFTQRIKCRGLFATHYHKLADAHADDPTTSIRHMACHVDRDAAGREQVTFLYQLQEGACPKSYGTACARLAGMPDAILDRAEALAAQLESSSNLAQSSAAARQPGSDRRSPQTEGVCNEEAKAWLKGLNNRLEAAGGEFRALAALQEEAQKLAPL